MCIARYRCAMAHGCSGRRSFTVVELPLDGLKAVRKRKAGGFTLIELLVVIAVIAILAALLLPALEDARRRANVVSCTSNLRQLAFGCQMYCGDHGDWYPLYGFVGNPGASWGSTGTWHYNWPDQRTAGRPLLAYHGGYVQTPNLFFCPEYGKPIVLKSSWDNIAQQYKQYLLDGVTAVGCFEVGYYTMGGPDPKNPGSNARYCDRPKDNSETTLIVDRSRWDSNRGTWIMGPDPDYGWVGDYPHKGQNMLFCGGFVKFFQYPSPTSTEGFLVVWGGGANNLHGTWHEPQRERSGGGIPLTSHRQLVTCRFPA